MKKSAESFLINDKFYNFGFYYKIIEIWNEDKKTTFKFKSNDNRDCWRTFKNKTIIKFIN